MKRTLIALALLLAAAAALFSGCGRPRPFTYHSGNEIPEGPGLFTREAGSFTIYSSKSAPSGAEKDPAAAAGRTAAPEKGPAPAGAAPADDAQFREFQQWRRERSAFEAFRQWKKSQEGAAEYEAFRDWQRWQEFKKWQESQPKDR